MKSPVVSLTLLTFLLFNFPTGTHAGLPKWGAWIAGPPPPPPPPAPLPAYFASLPPVELSSSNPPTQFVQEPDVSAAPSFAPMFVVDPNQSPELRAPVSAAELFESPQVSAAPLVPVSASSLVAEHAHPHSPCTHLTPTPTLTTTTSTSPTPVSVLQLLDAISVTPPLPQDENERLPVESELPLVTPAPTPDSLPLSPLHPDTTTTTTTHTRDRGSPEKRACFPSLARVTLHDGTRIPISRLRVGDLVESEPGHFSPVLIHTHADPHANTTFVVLRTRRGSQIAASPGHYLLAACGRLRLARQFRVHDTLRTASGVDHVVSVRHAVYRGLYNPQTASGKLMIAFGSEAPAIQTSTYTTAVLPNAAHAALSPLRALHTTLGITVPPLTAYARIIAESPILRAPHHRDSVVNRIAGRLPQTIDPTFPFDVRLVLHTVLTANK